jgi:DNA replication protein DnaC
MIIYEESIITNKEPKSNYMNTETLEKMKRMKLMGMYKAFKANLESEQVETYTPDEIIAHLVEAEYDERQNKNVQMKIRNARFRYKALLEDVNFDTERNMDKNQIMRLADCSFIKNGENILITGSTGIGKSYLASAFGHHACSMGFRVTYHNVPKLFSKLKMSKADGSYLREVAKIERQHLLILDDFGIQPFDAQSRAALMELIEDRHGKGSIVITSQVPVSKWFDIIGEQTIADAILDRIVHNAHRIELKGESLRKRKDILLEKNN